ncbi:MAG TPA: hypothetical protein VNW92_06570 [Polyangiaceae bacterium]|nr:hypothetical protein [Polyangiaceae bacterium]
MKREALQRSVVSVQERDHLGLEVGIGLGDQVLECDLCDHRVVGAQRFAQGRCRAWQIQIAHGLDGEAAPRFARSVQRGADRAEDRLRRELGQRFRRGSILVVGTDFQE